MNNQATLSNTDKRVFLAAAMVSTLIEGRGSQLAQTAASLTSAWNELMDSLGDNDNDFIEAFVYTFAVALIESFAEEQGIAREEAFDTLCVVKDEFDFQVSQPDAS